MWSSFYMILIKITHKLTLQHSPWAPHYSTAPGLPTTAQPLGFTRTLFVCKDLLYTDLLYKDVDSQGAL